MSCVCVCDLFLFLHLALTGVESRGPSASITEAEPIQNKPYLHLGLTPTKQWGVGEGGPSTKKTLSKPMQWVNPKRKEGMGVESCGPSASMT